MQSKEEIEKAKEYFKYQIELAHIEIEKHQSDEFKGYGTLEDIAKLNYCNLKVILNYIEQLETREQKLIEKLEKDKMEQFDDYTIYLIESYLKILKGENDE